MLYNYFKTGWRTLRRNLMYTTINVGGFALGLTCCVLIALYVQDELSYDAFHEKKDRLIFVGSKASFGGEKAERGQPTPYPLADALEREVSTVKRTVRTLWPSRSAKVSRDGQSFTDEERVFHAGPGFFEMFSFPLSKGKAALTEPGTAVISEALAARHFPDTNPIGQTLQFKDVRGDQKAYRITGVAHVPGKSYLDFNALLSLPTLGLAKRRSDSWDVQAYLTFALLEEGVSLDEFERQATSLFQQKYQQQRDREIEASLFAQPIASLYLSELIKPKGFRGERRYLYLFGAVAFFILLLACVNYVNLSTARATQRAKEVGVRRTVGARREQVAGQFLGESIFLTLIAFVLSLGMTRILLPTFNHLTDKDLSLLSTGPAFLLLLFGVVLTVGLVAGAYPALYLSGFRPMDVLRGITGHEKGERKIHKGLVVLQFAVAVALIAATGVVYQQLRYTQQKDLGFEEEQTVSVPLLDAQEQYAALKRSFQHHSGVVSVSAASDAPGAFGMRYTFSRSDSVSRGETGKMGAHHIFTDADYLETTGIALKRGRYFSPERPADSSGYVLNEAAVQKLGWESPLGHRLSYHDGDAPGRVIGVVKNFHFSSLREDIGPLVIRMTRPPSEPYASYHRLLVRLQPGQTEAVLGHLSTQWAQFSEEPFQYNFLDQKYASMYRTERRLGQLFAAFAAVAILIGCLGLFGLSAFAAERRKGEIAVRKTFGANAGQIVRLLSKEFLQLVGIGFVLGVPVAWFTMQRWLEDFAYRIELSPWLFATAGLVALLVATGATGWQALRAARTNPAHTLRDE